MTLANTLVSQTLILTLQEGHLDLTTSVVDGTDYLVLDSVPLG